MAIKEFTREIDVIATRWVVVISDCRFRMYGWALGNAGNYIEEETEDEGLVIFKTYEDAVSAAQESVRLSRGQSEGPSGLGVMHTAMKAGEWKLYTSKRKMRNASQ